MEKLPKVYQNEINKKIHNNKEVCYLKNERTTLKEKALPEQIDAKLDKIFSGMGYSYNIPVVISTVDKTYQTSLIARTQNHVVTLDNDVIMIRDIKNIEFK